jgi:endonuclease-8
MLVSFWILALFLLPTHTNASPCQMPEGDTIHKVAQALNARLTGVVLKDVQLRRLSSQRLIGLQVQRVYSKGKHLFIELADGVVLETHLGLYGSWHRYPGQAAWKKPRYMASVVLFTGTETFVCFSAREVHVRGVDEYAFLDVKRRLGPDLVRGELDSTLVLRRIESLLAPDTLLTDLLLDQRVACGIGNVYKSEVLFLQGQSPRRRIDQTAEDVLQALYATASDLLRRNLGGGPRRTRFTGDGRGNLWVYGRAASPCLRCGESVRWDHIGARPRSTYWCPACQR